MSRLCSEKVSSSLVIFFEGNLVGEADHALEVRDGIEVLALIEVSLELFDAFDESLGIGDGWFEIVVAVEQSFDPMEPDELLARLAIHDVTWKRSRVDIGVRFLKAPGEDLDLLVRVA